MLVTQCEKLHIPFLPDLPSAAEIDAEYHVIIDAVFGFSFKGAVRAPFDAVLSTLGKVSTPIASVDVPSGKIMGGGTEGGRGVTILMQTWVAVLI